MNWRIGFAVFSLVYVIWVVNLALNNFGMVHGEYRRVEKSLQPVQIQQIARRELVDQCRRNVERTGDPRATRVDEACRSWPAAVIAEKQKEVEARFVQQKSRVVRKLVTFYIFFGVVFLFLPLVVVYMLVSVVIWLFRNIKIVE